MSHIVKTTISLGGLGNITDFFHLNIHETLHGHQSFNLDLPFGILEKSNQTLTTSQQLVGEDIKVELKDKEGNIFLYGGIITNINFSKTSPLNMSISICGTSPSVMIDDHEFSRSYLDLKLNQIVENVLDGYRIKNKFKINPMYKESIPYLVQYRETPFQFLKRIANLYGEWFYYNGEDFIFGGLKSSINRPIELGDDLYSYSINLFASPLKDQGWSYNYQKDETYNSNTQYKKVSVSDKFSKEAIRKSELMFPASGNDIYSPKFGSKKALEKVQEMHKAGLISSMQIFQGDSSCVNIHIGSIVDITGTHVKMSGDISKGTPFKLGKYNVTDIQHSIGPKGDYNNHFRAIPEKFLHPPKNNINAIRSAHRQVASVIDNNDPEKLGRIVVKFPWMSEDEKTPWLRIINTHASLDRGFYFIPEIDDQVLVDFEGGDPDCPFVVGSYYHKKASPKKEWVDSNNNIKAIRTKSGNELVIDDLNGQESIKIFNPEKTNIITLTMEGQKKIRIESQGDIEMEAKNIKMVAQNVSMEVEQEIKTDCTTFENKATNMKFDADQGVQIKSTNFESKASASSVLESNMSTEIKGAQTKVEGSAQLDLKGGATASLSGGIVKIN